jgi:predicted GH43/DUF377 family glycosyl hydrolase
MATKIVKYTGSTQERIEDGHGTTLADVSPDDRLEEVGADLADWLVANKPDWEYYNGTKTVTNDDYSVVNGRNIDPESVTTDELPHNQANALDWNPPFNEWEAVSAVPAPSPEFGSWQKDGNNPVIEAAEVGFKDTVTHPSLLRLGDTYHVFFAAFSSDTTSAEIGHATSTDLVDWTMDSNNPVLTTSSSDFDDGRVYQPEILRVGNTYYLYYTGDSGDPNGDSAQIGVATADATLNVPFDNFSKSSNNPILSNGSTSDFDSEQVQEPGVFFDGGQYIMAYRGDGGGGEQMGIAYSDTPTTDFTKSDYNPVKSEGNVSSDSTVADHELIKIGGRYHLFYVSADEGGNDTIFYAHADAGDLTDWADHRDNPIVPSSDSAFDEQWTRGPSVLREPDQYIMLYDGKDASGTRSDIGLATLDIAEVA